MALFNIGKFRGCKCTQPEWTTMSCADGCPESSWFPGPTANKKKHFTPWKVTLRLNNIKAWGWLKVPQHLSSSMIDTNLSFCLPLYHTRQYILILWDQSAFLPQNHIFTNFGHPGLCRQPEWHSITPSSSLSREWSSNSSRPWALN